jgi:hypothetical protein
VSSLASGPDIFGGHTKYFICHPAFPCCPYVQFAINSWTPVLVNELLSLSGLDYVLTYHWWKLLSWYMLAVLLITGLYPQPESSGYDT